MSHPWPHHRQRNVCITLLRRHPLGHHRYLGVTPAANDKAHPPPAEADEFVAEDDVYPFAAAPAGAAGS